MTFNQVLAFSQSLQTEKSLSRLKHQVLCFSPSTFFTSVNSYNIEDDSKDSKNPVFIRPGDVYSNNQDQFSTCNVTSLLSCLGSWVLSDVNLENAPTTPCCSLLAGMGNLEAAVRLCTAMKVEMLGLPIDLNIALRAELSFCGREGAPEYNCSA